MKVNSRSIALMVAMAACTAAAAPRTTAGTEIKNVASASFTDPSTGVAVVNPVLSNEVITTVTPITGFDIIYKGSQADGTTASTPATGTPTYDIPNVAATSNTATNYSVVNNSNINGYVVNLAADTTGTENAPTSVKYYPAGTTSFVPANEITSVTLADTGTNSTKDIIQVITITGAAATNKFSASPKGTAPASTDTTAYPTAPSSGAFTQYIEATNNTTTGDLQFTRVTVATAVVTLEPPADTTPGTPAVTPPVSGTVPGVTGPTVTNPNTYTPPANTGVTNNPGTTITADPTTGDQAAYPKSDTNTASDIVTFVGDVKNGGLVADVMKIKIPTAGLPTGTIIKVLDKDGNVLTPDPTALLYTLPGGPVAPGGSVPFQVVVTYPDSDTSATKIDVPVQVFSGNVPSTNPLDTGTLTIYPPDMQFGDTVGSAPTGMPNSALTPTETVSPGGATNLTLNTTADASAVFPMSVRNTGTYAETYTLTATDIIFKDVNGNNLPAATVTYYTATGVALTGGVTSPIDPGKSADFYAVVNVPAGAVATTGVNIATPTTANPFPQPLVLQTATGNYSGDTATDTNDEIKVAVVNTKPTTSTDPTTGPSNANSGIAVAKYQTKGATAPTPVATDINTLNAAPGDTIRYAIIAKNNFNSIVKNFVLTDSNATGTTNVYTFSDFVSASATALLADGTTSFGTVFYKVNGGTFTATAPATGTVITSLEVAVDTDASSTITAADIVPAKASIRLDIAVKVK
ncbi:hypothetical protein E7T06_18300 [Deinococcus sp. Arct2-2]|uniref:beta strand repeat-containing protein n=1 Tax=Deinococcus sp. Arct2-2 TaxID=2568653 RepID=UPI0010A4412E|nr:hypothetical protein [Deinococcus sp. Arct2-2]THF68066.1 hypothetical protein E7T06_18300 [Deinococcus sp. Arct2-2]